MEISRRQAAVLIATVLFLVAVALTQVNGILPATTDRPAAKDVNLTEKVANITHWKGSTAYPVSPDNPNYTELRQLVVTAITGQGNHVEAVTWGPCLAEARKESILQVAFSEPINPAGAAYNHSFTYYILPLHDSPEIHPVRPGVGCGTFESTIDWQRQANALLPTSHPTNATRCERTDFRITNAIYDQETGNTTVRLLNTGSTTFSFLLTVKSDTATTTEPGELLIDGTANISLHSGQPVQTVKAFAYGCPNSTVTSNITAVG